MILRATSVVNIFCNTLEISIATKTHYLNGLITKNEALISDDTYTKVIAFQICIKV